MTNNRKQADRKPLPFHPFLLALFPILSLTAVNFTQIQPAAGWRLALLSIALVSLVFLLAGLLLRNIQRAAALSSFLILLFYTYGQLYDWLGTAIPGLAHHRILLPVFTLAGVLACIGVLKIKSIPAGVTIGLNVLSLLLLVAPAITIATDIVRVRNARNAELLPGSQSSSSSVQSRPDIYYIILDMYARDDLLQDEMGFDNTPFLKDLEQRGFYIARCSMSNYDQTELSLASSLNMNYLDALGQFPADSNDRTMLPILIHASQVRSELEGLGYRIVSLSAYEPLQLPDANVFYDPALAPLPASARPQVISPFESLILKSTLLRAYLDSPWARAQPLAVDINNPYGDHIREQLYILDSLLNIPVEQPGPKFVFVHIQLPHPPYVFTADGELVQDPPPFPSAGQNIPRDVTVSHYLAQVEYINRRILTIVDAILMTSGSDTMIVLQGDHGPWSLKYPFANYPGILNAYHLPARLQEQLYPDISPVNTFRLILGYFPGLATNFLPDKAFMSTYDKPYDLIPTVNERSGCR